MPVDSDPVRYGSSANSFDWTGNVTLKVFFSRLSMSSKAQQTCLVNGQLLTSKHHTAEEEFRQIDEHLVLYLGIIASISQSGLVLCKGTRAQAQR